MYTPTNKKTTDVEVDQKDIEEVISYVKSMIRDVPGATREQVFTQASLYFQPRINS